MIKLSKKMAAASEWLWVRKETTPAHWAFGGFCAALSALFFPAGWLAMGAFGVWEHWNDKCEGTHQGFRDWWEAFLLFIIGLAVLVILQFCDKFTITWY